MIRCLNCGKRMQYRREFYSEDCMEDYFGTQEPEENLEVENDD